MLNKESSFWISSSLLMSGGYLMGLSSFEVIPLFYFFLGFLFCIIAPIMSFKNLNILENLSDQEIKDKVDLILLRKGKLK